MSGSAERRQAARDRPDRRDVECEGLDRGDGADDGHERTRNARSEAAQAEDHRQRARADEQRQALRVAEMGDEVPGLLEEVARPRADPEQLRQLADDDREREADDQALEHGRADELGQEAEAQQTRDQGGDARRDGQAGGERDEALAPHRGQIGDRGRRQGRGGRHGSHDEHARAAKGRVQQQRAGRRVEADDRRDVRDARVRERLRNQDRPEREARDQIGAKPRALIAVQRKRRAASAGGHVGCGKRSTSRPWRRPRSLTVRLSRPSLARMPRTMHAPARMTGARLACSPTISRRWSASRVR